MKLNNKTNGRLSRFGCEVKLHHSPQTFSFDEGETETVIVFVEDKYIRHERAFDYEPEHYGTWAEVLLCNIEAKGVINLKHWRELNESEAEVLKEAGEYNLFTEENERREHHEGLAMAGI